jgi:hypothetical protein
MPLLDLLKAAAMNRNLLEPGTALNAATVFALVRDMPYSRASSREPEVTIREWRGTCSGKHYLLQALLAELGLRSRVMACSTELLIDPDQVPAELRPILQEVDGRIVDVHNYLVVELPAGETIVDATWPLKMESLGFEVNKTFNIGQDQQLTCTPIERWIVPEDRDPQEFKETLLRELFTTEELEQRNEFISTFSTVLAKQGEDG